MTVILLSLLALVAYVLGTATHVRAYLGLWQPQTTLAFALGAAAAALHLAVNLMLITSPLGADFSLFKSASLITNVIVTVLLFLSWRKPIQNLFMIAFPLAIVSLALALAFATSTSRIPKAEVGILFHASLSIVAYSFFSVAALQALLLYIQNKQLKAHVNSRLVQALPPLQTMETILFMVIRIGFILLTLAIVTGAVFVENLFAQHLVHKTTLTIFAWIVFAILLFGHHLYGWRGLTASRWTLTGALVLMVGYLGSKLVLEVILA